MNDLQKKIAKIIAAAWTDDGFRERLTAPGNSQGDIKRIIKDRDLEFPEIDDLRDGGTVQFVANTADTRYIIIPQKPEFTDKDMGLIIQLRLLLSDVCTCKSCPDNMRAKLAALLPEVYGDE
jgi:hypothetical protein